MQMSVVPVYQSLARGIGLDWMQQEIHRVGFENQKVGQQADNFCLVNPLKITPEQEAQFAYQLATEQLPFDASVQKQVKKFFL